MPAIHHPRPSTHPPGSRSNIDAPMGLTHMPLRHLLALGCFSDTYHAQALLLVDWHGHFRPLVAPPLSQGPGVQDFAPQTIRWPTLSLPLPNGPGILVNVDYFGPLPLTPRGNAYPPFQ